MDFYQALSPFYDEIFPASAEAVTWLAEWSRPRNSGAPRVLDVACGTGTHALELAKLGRELLGMDIDESMVQRARHKSVDSGGGVEFLVGDMRDLLDVLPDRRDFDLVYCIGNSLVHLSDEGEVAAFARGAYGLLAPGGHLCIQILNYDRILEERRTELPLVEVLNGEVTFERSYRFSADDAGLEFVGELRVTGDSLRRLPPGAAGEGRFSNSVRLLPLGRAPLTGILEQAGYESVDSFSDFSGGPFDPDGFMLLLAARRGPR